MKSTQKDRLALVALGGNLPGAAGDSAQLLREALAALTVAGLTPVAISRFFRTPAFPPGSGPDFVNAAAAFRTTLSPEAILASLHAVEAAHGRERQVRWGARTLDLDLIAVDDLVLPDAETQTGWRALDPAQQRSLAPDRLILPHPRLQDRAFVLVPLSEVAPNWRHPLTGQTVLAMLSALSAADKADIHAIR